MQPPTVPRYTRTHTLPPHDEGSTLRHTHTTTAYSTRFTRHHLPHRNDTPQTAGYPRESPVYACTPEQLPCSPHTRTSPNSDESEPPPDDEHEPSSRTRPACRHAASSHTALASMPRRHPRVPAPIHPAQFIYAYKFTRIILTRQSLGVPFFPPDCERGVRLDRWPGPVGGHPLRVPVRKPATHPIRVSARDIACL